MATSNTHSIRFLLNGDPITVDNPDPNRSLLQYLREDLGCCGTKEGCAEGDCGACTVLLGELGADGAAHYHSINACIRFLPTVHGREVVTVEGLTGDDGSLHPAQQSISDHHGSQCGFCTPGFVMSLADLYLNKGPTDSARLADALAGNLCRCTGYRPILDAGAAMFEYPAPASWAREATPSQSRGERLRELRAATPTPQVEGYSAPRDIAELAEAYRAHPDASLVAGATDVGLWVNKQLRELPDLIYVGDVAELRRVEDDTDALVVGAGASLEAAFQALTTRYPTLDEITRRFASPPIRHAATLGGNIANASPIGDSMPVLLALDAELLLRCGERQRRVPLDTFYTGYQRSVLEPGEFIEAVRIPHASTATRLAGYKVSKRRDQDISGLCAGIAVTIDDQQRMRGVRLGFGGMAVTPQRARHAEAALEGQPWQQAAFDAAGATLAQDFQPITDMRASAAYRALVAANLLKRFYLSYGGVNAPMSLEAFERSEPAEG